MTVRIIPRLDIKGPNLVKGIHLEGLRVLGQPSDFARHYYEQGADELIYMDVVASLYQRNSLLSLIEKASQEIFIPLTVGGGLRTIEDIRKVLRAGADKVSLNTAAIADPTFITKAARTFGSSTIVISIEAIKKLDGTYEAFTDNGREETGLNAVEWAKRVEELGAGEIYLTSIDREGTGKGFDVDLTQKIATKVSIPVISCGGAGSSNDVVQAVNEGKADAVSLASILHYGLIEHADHSHDNKSEGNVEYLKSGRTFSKIKGKSLIELKKDLLNQKVECRPHVDFEVSRV